MKIFTLLCVLVFCVPITPQTHRTTSHAKKHKVPCKPDLAHCPNEGCGTDFDPNLNRLKNITTLNGPSTLHSLAWMKKLDDPETFSEGDARDELAALGEGQKITVMAYLLVAKPEWEASLATAAFRHRQRRITTLYW